MLSAGRGDLRTSLFLGMVLLSNVLFLGVVTYRAGHYAYRRTWSIVQGASTKRRYRGDGVALRALGGMLVFLPRRLRLLVVKDLRTFLRDASQWSQFLLFFGLLALYIINLPRFGVEDLPPHWRSLVSNLNLGATCLTLATLTSRFVFPQLSLEGRRIWVTGLLPMRRALIIWGKFFFAAVGTRSDRLAAVDACGSPGDGCVRLLRPERPGSRPGRTVPATGHG
jgi:ABC-2 type transport system permease protein